ncbi:MAG TPA: hypothetical protein VF053_00475 [Streptosporangiales bacterium]
MSRGRALGTLQVSRDELNEELPGAWTITDDKFASAMNPFGGRVSKTSLSDDAERELAEAIAGNEA